MTEPLTVTIDARTALESLTEVTERAQDLRPVLDGPVERLVREMFVGIFASKGASIGKPWAPLSPVTEAIKRRAGREKFGPERFTDLMFRSLTVRGATQQVKQVTADSLTFGTGVPYAALQHEGWVQTTIFGRLRKQPKQVPGRALKPDELPGPVATAITETIQRYVMTGDA